ncbi:MAG: trimeric intracellular cation channel family protein [Clostridia bacterium]|nr:trimeric intracellular cation channel family protein [Clostridia bacterium]
MEAASIIFSITEILGIVAFAVSGAMISIHRKMDFFGVVFLSLVTALGGGAVRDLFLGVIPPRNFFNFAHLTISIVTASIIFVLAQIFRRPFFKNYKRINHLVNVFDAIGLASFAVTGVNLTVQKGYGDHEFFVVFMGILTAVGGGLLRDVMSKQKPMIFCKNIYATAVLFGTIIYYVMMYVFKLPEIPSTIAAYVIIITIRMLASVFRWDLPVIEDPTQTTQQ